MCRLEAVLNATSASPGTAISHPAVLCCAAVLSCLQTATLRILIGMTLVALQNFSAGLDLDKALLAGTSSSSSTAANASNNGNGTSSSASSSAAAAAPAGNGAEQVQQAPAAAAAAAAVEPLTGDMQLAVMFRSQKKQLLLDVISGLAEKLKQVCVVLLLLLGLHTACCMICLVQDCIFVMQDQDTPHQLSTQLISSLSTSGH